METNNILDTLEDSPCETANPISKATFLWTIPTFLKGQKEPLTTQDLTKPLKEQETELLADQLQTQWDEECKNARLLEKEPSLFKATLRTFKKDVILFGVLRVFLELVLNLAQPIFLQLLIAYFSITHDGQTKSKGIAMGYGSGIVVCVLLSILIKHPTMMAELHVGLKMKAALSSVIYRKSLKVTQSALTATSPGQVVNLMANDVSRFELLLSPLHYLWIGPIQMFMAAAILYRVVSFAVFFGVALIILLIPLQLFLGKMSSNVWVKLGEKTDERICLMGEIVQGIQVIKMYAWEKPFSRMIGKIRGKELKLLRKVLNIRGVLFSFYLFGSRLAVFFVLITFVLLQLKDGNLTAERAFAVTAFFNVIKASMCSQFPFSIARIVEVSASSKRIQAFLLAEEMTNDKSQVKQIMVGPIVKEPVEMKTINAGTGTKDSAVLNADHVSAKWSPNTTERTLDNISFDLRKGELMIVVGAVGSGKSSLLQAILNELSLEKGNIEVRGNISYASQDPWLFAGSIRQNILFGELWDRKRYEKVIKDCALERDFTILPKGDRTIIGAGGSGLSGGQKARINLARAMYRSASIYLLDDPMSAMDAHVGRQLFDNCIKAYTKWSVVVLATHQLQYLPQADKILVLGQGKVLSYGSYQSLMESGIDFVKLLEEEEKEEMKRKTIRQSITRKLKTDTLVQRPSKYFTKKLTRRFTRDTLLVIPEANESPLKKKGEDDIEVVNTDLEEAIDQGLIGFKTFMKYFQAAGGYGINALVVLLFIISQALASTDDFYVNYWVSKKEERQALGIKKKDTVFELVFSTLIILTILMTLSRSFAFFAVTSKASQWFHDTMFNGIIRTTMHFFNNNPAGRILNRFSRDMSEIGESLPSALMDIWQVFFDFIGSIALIGFVNFWLLIPASIMLLLFYLLKKFYTNASTSVKRMSMITRSPVLSHLGTSLDGLATIRVFSSENMLIHEFDRHQNLNTSASFLFIALNRAFALWIDIVSTVFISLVVASVFVFAQSAASVGLAITQALGLTLVVQFVMRRFADLENSMTSVERCLEYQDLESEGGWYEVGFDQTHPGWPKVGKVRFDKLSLRYEPSLESNRVLKELSFEIEGQEKVGIVGRTGAGKSTIINAMFRLSYNEGKILIDGIDIHRIGLHDLRQQLAIIPQVPMLFSGTMRFNLDPFKQYTDSDLWMALEKVNLKGLVSSTEQGLEMEITDGGNNFSIGQRQLVCLARALLRKNKILIMDEATANVDMETDQMIQQTIRTGFKDCTVLTIAHRLNTIIDSDKVLVMDAGRNMEFDSPYNLLQKGKTGAEVKIFYELAQQSGTLNQLEHAAQKKNEDDKKKK